MTGRSVYERLSRRPVPDVIAERITALIAAGSLRPGDRLPSEPALAGQLGVGRSSLREAIRKLQTLGVVEAKRGTGTFVREPPEGDPTLRFLRWRAEEGFAIAEVLEARIGLEVVAAGLACLRSTADDLEVLDQRNVEHEAAHVAGDLAAVVRTDQWLHAALIRAAHNEVLEQLYAPLVGRLVEFRRRTLALAGMPERSVTDHRRVIAAIRARDPAAARQEVVRHLGTLYREVRGTDGTGGPDRDEISALLAGFS